MAGAAQLGLKLQPGTCAHQRRWGRLMQPSWALQPAGNNPLCSKGLWMVTGGSNKEEKMLCAGLERDAEAEAI